MGKKKAKDEAEASEGGGKAKLVVGAVVLVAVGVLAGGRLLGGSTPADAAEATTTTTEPTGPITTVESITVNLADGHFLKVGMAFEVRPDETYPHVGGHGEVDELTKGFARELDASIMVLSRFTYDQLVAPGGKEGAKAALLEALAEVSHGAVHDVLFHEFVMQ